MRFGKTMIDAMMSIMVSSDRELQRGKIRLKRKTKPQKVWAGRALEDYSQT